MSFTKELLELLVALSPLLIELMLCFSKPKTIARWVAAVLAGASLAVISTGFSMMRFIGKCAGEVPVCEPEYSLMPWYPGLIQPATPTSCFRCVPLEGDLITTLTAKMNAWTPQISLIAAVACVLASGVILVRFAGWSRVNYRRGGD